MDRDGQAHKGRGAEERGRDRAGAQGQDYEGAPHAPPPRSGTGKSFRELKVEHGEAKGPQKGMCGGR